MNSDTLVDTTTTSNADVSTSAPSTRNETICCGCNHPNPLNRRYCSQCGQSLWIACPACSTDTAVHESFCGSCGTNLAEDRRKRRDELDRRIEEVAVLFDQRDYANALHLLRPFAKESDPHLKPQRDQAEQWKKRLETALAKAKDDVSKTCTRAEQQLAQGDFNGAWETLKQVPEKLHTPTLQELLQQARDRRDELGQLTDEMAEHLRANQFDELGVKLERILQLQPGHATAQRLSVKLRDRQLRMAETYLAANRYAEAIGALDGIPISQCDESIDKLRSTAAELDWIMTDLEQAPIVDQPLLDIAQRLTKLRPADEQASRLANRVRKRASAPPADPRFGAPCLAGSNQSTFGFPIDWLAFPGRIALSKESGGTWQKCKGQFWASCGLALQGLRRAAINVNLLPSRSESVLQRLTRRREKAATAAWGLDLGSTSLKAVRLIVDGDGNQVSIDRTLRMEHRESLTLTEDASKRQAILAETLTRFLEQERPKSERVCVGLSGSSVLGRFLRLPPVQEKQMPDAIMFAAQQRFPLSLEELAWDYHAWPIPDEDDEGESGTRIALHATKRSQVQELTTICEEIGLGIDVLTSVCLALHNLADFELLGDRDQEPDDCSAVAVLDIGAQSSELVIASRSSTWFRSIGCGGDLVTRKLSKVFRLTQAQAEQVKRNPTKSRRLLPLFNEIDPVMTQLADELRRSFEQHDRVFPDIKIRRLFGCGGGFELHGLLRKLTMCEK